MIRNTTGSAWGAGSGAPVAVGGSGDMYGVDDALDYPGSGNSLHKSRFRWAETSLIKKYTPIRNVHILESGAVLFGEKNIYRIDEITGDISLVFTYPDGCYMEIFSISSSGKNVVLADYGARGVARKVYLSSDDGKTFTQIFEIPYDANHHVHVAHYDKYTDQIWVTHGDDEGSSIYVADPPYNTFTSIHADQPTAIACTPSYVLFGKDYNPYSPLGGENGVIRYNRITGVFDRVLTLTKTTDADYDQATFSMFYDPEKDTVYMATNNRSTAPADTTRFGVWRSKGEPYEVWEQIADLNYAQGYRGFLKIAGIYKNILYAWAQDNDFKAHCYEIRLGPVLRTRNKLR